MPDTPRPAVLETLERAAKRGYPRGKVHEADAARLRTLANAIAHQPILYCAEKENPVTDHNRGTVRVCGWCAGCELDRLLTEGEPDGD